MERSRGQADAILSRRDWQRLGHRLGLNVELDTHRQEVRALRGDYRLRFDAILDAAFIPSAFNEGRYWTVLGGVGKSHACFPYFDPALLPDGDENSALPRRKNTTKPALDVALIFRALGDATHLAIASLIALRSMSATEIARQLRLSKPTVTHHLYELRQAGLIEENQRGVSIFLSLSRSPIEKIGDLAIASLFDSIDSGRIRRTRRTQ